jgi:cell division inhibitor SepF
MGLFDKLKSMVGTEPDYDKDEYYPDPLEGEEVPPTRQSAQTQGMDISGTDSTSLELKVVRPENYASVTEIADHLLNNNTVVLNLEATNREVAKRLIDFLAGVAYSIGGQLKNVSNNTYIITPRNVDVADARVKSNSAPQPAPAQNTAPAIGLTSDTLF